MRVIAGHLKGRRLQAPRGLRVRPTTDRVKEALFSILGAHVVGARVLDLYAGTGALGIEALSRGAAAVTFVEHHPASVKCLRQNLEACGLTGAATVKTVRVESFLERPVERSSPFDVLLADPPYEQVDEIAAWGVRLSSEIIAHDGVAVIEHGAKWSPPSRLGPLSLLRTYSYGDTALSIFRHQASEAAP